jgi:hypothetical protein
LILVHGNTTRPERTRPGARGANHQFEVDQKAQARRGTAVVGSVRLKVELWLQATSIMSIRIAVSGYSFSNMRIPRAYALTTTTGTNNTGSAHLITKS